LDERTTQELIEILGDDVERCHKELVDSLHAGEVDTDGSVSADYEFHARKFIRAAIAYIEGVTFSVKCKAVDDCLNSGIEVSDHERYLAVEIDAELNDKGEVVERPSKLRLADNIKFAFRMLERSQKTAKVFDPSSEWWSCLRSTIRVRDRLTHPKMPEDIDISGDEIIQAQKAVSGFEDTLMRLTKNDAPT
jgi:hypothetical protein